MKRVIACILIVSLIGPANVSGDCTNFRVRNTNYNQHHVTTNYGYQYEHHQQTVVAIPVATFVPVPLYVANYVQPPVTAAIPTAPNAPAVATATDTNAEMLKLLKSMDARLQALEKPKTPAPPPMPPAEEADPKLGARLESKGLTILKKSCLACHESKIATDLGGGFTLFNGLAIAKLSDKQKLKIFKHVEENTMPKLDPKFPTIVKLTDPEASEVKDFILKLN